MEKEARMVEVVDTTGLKPVSQNGSAGSSPAAGTKITAVADANVALDYSFDTNQPEPDNDNSERVELALAGSDGTGEWDILLRQYAMTEFGLDEVDAVEIKGVGTEYNDAVLIATRVYLGGRFKPLSKDDGLDVRITITKRT